MEEDVFSFDVEISFREKSWFWIQNGIKFANGRFSCIDNMTRLFFRQIIELDKK